MRAYHQMAGALASWRDRLREQGKSDEADHVQAILTAYGPVDVPAGEDEQATTTSAVHLTADRPVTLYNALLLGGAEVAYPMKADQLGVARGSVLVGGVRLAISGSAPAPVRFVGELEEREAAQ
jgi:hypothetical protein